MIKLVQTTTTQNDSKVTSNNVLQQQQSLTPNSTANSDNTISNNNTQQLQNQDVQQTNISQQLQNNKPIIQKQLQTNTITTQQKYANYDPNVISDDEDNSWADELSHSGGGGSDAGGGELDDYYGEEDGDYGDESINKGVAGAKDADESYVSKKKSNKRVTINVYCTEYDVVKKVARKVNNFRMKELEEDHEGAVVKGQGNQKLSTVWDISWHDLAITPDYLSKMQIYQKVNHFPGMYVVCRKNFLARNLMKMQRQFPEEYSFFPKTWLLPSEQIEFRNQFTSIGPNGKANPKSNKKKTYIVKPEALSQGKGIFLSRSLDEIMDSCQTEGCVVQRYIHQPYLIDDLKFDLRIYVMLYGVNPLRIYFHEMGLARFATEEYQCPLNSNLDNLYMHLTNYAINKHNNKFQQNEDEEEDDQGHKRSLTAILCLLKQEGHDPEKLLKEMKDIIVKTLVIGQPYLSHLYKSCQPEDLDNSMCFQILGFDIILDHKCKPWLLEVNQSPSFSTDSPLDYKIKKQVIGDAFNLLNCSYEKRQESIKIKKQEMEKRIMTGKTLKIGGEDKEKLRQEKLKERFEFEKNRTGGYELIYPSQDDIRNKQYENFIQKANDLWDDFTTGGKSKKANQTTDNKKPGQQIVQRNNNKLQVQSTIVQKRPLQNQQQQNQVMKHNTMKDNQIKSGEASQKTSARDASKQILQSQNTNNSKQQQQNMTQQTQQSLVTRQSISDNQGKSNDLMIESISNETNDKDSMVNPKLRMSLDANQNSKPQNPYINYNKNLQQNNIKQQDKQPYQSNSQNTYMNATNQRFGQQQMNTSQELKNINPHQKANSLTVQHQQQLSMQKNSNFQTTNQSNKFQSTYQTTNSNQDASKLYEQQQQSLQQTVATNVSENKVIQQQQQTIMNRHSNGNRTVINSIIQGMKQDSQQNYNHISQTSIEIKNRQTPLLRLQTEPQQMAGDGNAILQNSNQGQTPSTNDILKMKRKQVNLFQDQKNPLPKIQQHQTQQQMALQQYYAQQQLIQQQQYALQQQQKQQIQAQQALRNGNQNNIAMQRNQQQQKSGTLIQISSMPIYLNNQPNIFMQSQKLPPESPVKRIPLPDLNNQTQQQSQTNRQNQLNQQKLLQSRPIQAFTNQQTTNMNNGGLKKPSSSALSHSPSMRPQATSKLQPHNNMKQVPTSSLYKTNKQSNIVGSMTNSFKLQQQQVILQQQQYYNQAVLHQQNIQFGLGIVPIKAQHNQVISAQQQQQNAMNLQGKTLMPKLFDFNMIEDMQTKKQQQNQREIEEALQQIERQKQQKQAIIHGINNKR